MTVWSRPSAHRGVQGGQARYILGLPPLPPRPGMSPSRLDSTLPLAVMSSEGCLLQLSARDAAGVHEMQPGLSYAYDTLVEGSLRHLHEMHGVECNASGEY